MMNRILLAALAAAAAQPALAQTPATDYPIVQVEIFDRRAVAVQFGCDAPTGSICYFHVQSSLRGFAQRFAVQAGRKVTLSGHVPIADRYMVTINQVPPLQLDCRLAPDPRKFCKVATLQAGYNN